MIHDINLRFASNQKPTTGVYGVNTRGIYPMPLGFDGAALAVDLLTIMDKGQGSPLTMRFDVKTTFASADTGLLVALAILVAASDDLTSAPLVVAQGPDILVSALVAGTFYNVALPSLSSIHRVTSNLGKRYLGAGLYITSSTIGIAGTLFSAGAMDVWLLVDAPPADLPQYASGFNAAGT